MTHDTKDLFRSQFDKILLTGLIILFMGFMSVLLVRFPNLDQSTLQWIEKSIDIVTGALVGAITTGLAVRRSESNTETVTAKPGGGTETKTESRGKTEIGVPPLSPTEPAAVVATGGFGATGKTDTPKEESK